MRRIVNSHLTLVALHVRDALADPIALEAQQRCVEGYVQMNDLRVGTIRPVTIALLLHTKAAVAAPPAVLKILPSRLGS